eukprot:jgi/Tetstr1/437216/TSEL_025946.t1
MGAGRCLAEAVGVALLALLSGCAAEPWNLPTYELCHHSRLARIPNEASGVTYSHVTNSLYVITRRPSAVGEYSLRGDYLRMYSHSGLRDPEGITWMYDYNFAVAQEGGGIAAITIMELAPWSRAAILQKKLVMRSIRCQSNFCLEGITYDAVSNVFYAMQEMNPMRIWRITMDGQATQIMNGRENWDRNIVRDLAGTYFRPGDDGLYILSQTEQTVIFMTWEGEIEDDQVIRVRDNVVEGLTFTPDGALMITVGEPNDLWIYSTDGNCNWRPSDMAQEDMALLAPAQTAPEVKEPANERGYCNWDGCDGQVQGSEWCSLNVDHCVPGCGGTWCWFGGIGRPISPENYVAPAPPAPLAPPTDAPTPAPTPPRPGFCGWDTCDGGRSEDPWCSLTAINCVVSCGGQFCWDDGGEPVTRDNIDLPETAAPTPTPAPAAAPTPAPSTSPATTPAPQTTTPAVDLPGTSPFNPDFANGSEAVIHMSLQGMSPATFTPLQQLYFREAVANAAYGNPDAFLIVVFDINGGNDLYNLFSTVFEDSLDQESVGDVLDAMAGRNRRLLQEQEHLEVKVHLLGETKQHALLLATKLQNAVDTGAFESDLRTRGFVRNTAVSVLDVDVQAVSVAPQYYPPNLVNTEEEAAQVPVLVPDSYEEIEVTDSTPFGLDTNTIIIIGGAAGGVLVTIIGIAATVCVCRRRNRAGKAQNTSGRKVSFENGADQSKAQPDSSAFTPNAAGNGLAVQMGDLNTSPGSVGEGGQPNGGRRGHQRMPSDVAAIAGLLQFEDNYTPTGTPGHSRNTSTVMSEFADAATGSGARHARSGSDAALLSNKSWGDLQGLNK